MTISEAIQKRREKQGWRCFHCDEVFHNHAKAEEHFGRRLVSQSACQVDMKQFREMELQLEDYHHEDSKVLRKMAAMEGEHSAALRREEEKGYARGLRDAKRYPETLGLTESLKQ
jgi:hypothetical protein